MRRNELTTRKINKEKKNENSSLTLKLFNEQKTVTIIKHLQKQESQIYFHNKTFVTCCERTYSTISSFYLKCPPGQNSLLTYLLRPTLIAEF